MIRLHHQETSSKILQPLSWAVAALIEGNDRQMLETLMGVPLPQDGWKCSTTSRNPAARQIAQHLLANSEKLDLPPRFAVPVLLNYEDAKLAYLVDEKGQWVAEMDTEFLRKRKFLAKKIVELVNMDQCSCHVALEDLSKSLASYGPSRRWMDLVAKMNAEWNWHNVHESEETERVIATLMLGNRQYPLVHLAKAIRRAVRGGTCFHKGYLIDHESRRVLKVSRGDLGEAPHLLEAIITLVEAGKHSFHLASEDLTNTLGFSHFKIVSGLRPGVEMIQLLSDSPTNSSMVE